MAENEVVGKAIVDMFRDLARRLSPSEFGNQIMRSKFKAELDDWQAKVLDSKHPRKILNTSRQVGKSTVTALLALFTAIFEKDALVLILAPSERQAKELFRKVIAFARMFEDLPETTEDNKTSIAFVNGSRIVALPGTPDTIRGFSGPRLVVIDEAAFTSDALYKAVRPMLAVNSGKLVLLSTPNGKLGFYFEAWENQDGWEKYQVSADDVPRISRQFLEEERIALGDTIFLREYYNEFVDVEGAVFSYRDIQNMFVDDEVDDPIFPADDSAEEVFTDSVELLELI